MASAKEKLSRKTKEQIAAREAQVAAFVASLDRFLDRNLEEILGEIETGAIKGVEAANVLGGIMEQLNARGLTKEVGKLEAIYGAELRAVRQALDDADKSDVLTEVDFQLTETLINFDVTKVENRIVTHVDDLRSTIMRTVIVGETPDVKQLRQDFGSGVAANIETEIRTGIQGFNRTLILAKAEEADLDLFIYLGPDDKVTRPFCDARVNGIFTRSEIKAWDNGQGLPAEIYLGGYNCRHQLRPISPEMAKSLGYLG